MEKKTTYADAGVDIAAAEQALARAKSAITATHTDAVITGPADFGGMIALGAGMADPVLVSGADGVGTKLKIAFAMDKHDTVGQDCVAMNVDDIVCMGARPLFFLDYLGIGRLRPGVVESIIEGVAAACQAAGCVLLGGETAELPGMYAEGEYDLAGFAVGVVGREQIIDGSQVREGDVILGLASSGLHSNGYSLARKALLEMAGYSLDAHIDELGCALGEELLRPTRLYCADLCRLFSALPLPHGIAHVTGGGWLDNVSRPLPEGLFLRLSASAVPPPPVFGLIQSAGNVETAEMYRTFNMGLGMALVLAPEDVDDWARELTQAGHQCFLVGEVLAGEGPGAIEL